MVISALVWCDRNIQFDGRIGTRTVVENRQRCTHNLHITGFVSIVVIPWYIVATHAAVITVMDFTTSRLTK